MRPSFPSTTHTSSKCLPRFNPTTISETIWCSSRNFKGSHLDTCMHFWPWDSELLTWFADLGAGDTVAGVVAIPGTVGWATEGGTCWPIPETGAPHLGLQPQASHTPSSANYKHTKSQKSLLSFPVLKCLHYFLKIKNRIWCANLII